MKKQSFVFGAVLLAVSGIFCKILGAVYKIPLSNILGSQGMGIYYLIFPIYAFLLTLTSSSFSTAISKNVSEVLAENKKLYAHKIFKGSLILLCILGFIASCLLIALSYTISHLQGLKSARICYIAIAPSILLVAISSSFKGYFQGLQNMSPTAIAQILGQLFKLSVGFLLAKVLSSKGVLFGTVGAFLGITIAEVITCLFFIIYYFIFKFKHKNYFLFLCSTQEEKSYTLKHIIKNLFYKSVPFILSSVILPMSMVIDSFLIINILKSMQFDKVFATSLLGLNSGIVNTLVSLPSTLSVAICMTIVPYISFALSKKDFVAINQKTALALKLTTLISLPCVFVFALFGKNILSILYVGSFSSFYELEVAATLLSLSSINVLYFALLQLSTALLQSVNKAYIPVASLSFSLILKVLFEIILINNPYLNIAGAVVSNTICYIVSCCINIFSFKKYINTKFSFYQTVVCPLVASFGMCLIIYFAKQIFSIFLGLTLSVVLSFIFGFIFYIVLVLSMKVFTFTEVQSLLFFKKFKIKRESKS